MSNSEVVENNAWTLPLMTYTLFPQTMNFDILSNYENAGKEVDYCALIEYYLDALYEFDIIDVKKDMIYIGFYSELFWDHQTNSKKSYYTGAPSSTSRVGYDFEKNSSIYFPTIRSWFDVGSQGNGFTTFVSTYIFAGSGSIGATLSVAFTDEIDSILGVANYDILPYTSIDDKNGIIRKLFFDPDSPDEFQYMMIDSVYVEIDNYNTNKITNDLAIMIYASSTDTPDDTQAKIDEIRQNFKAETFVDMSGEEIVYFSYYIYGEQKYLFFSEIELMRTKNDGTELRSSVNKVGFTGNAKSLNKEINDLINSLTIKFISFNIAFAIVITICSLFMSIYISRMLVDSTMNKIIKMCIKIKIAQTSHAKARRMYEIGEEQEMTITLRSKEEQESGVDQILSLFTVIEDILRIFKVKNFILKESNTQEQNISAIYEYSDIIDIYNENHKRIQKSKKMSDKEYKIFLVKHHEILSKFYNNIACLWYALDERVESNKFFEKSEMEFPSNIEFFDMAYPNIKERSRVTQEKSARLLNYARLMIREAGSEYNISNIYSQEHIEKFKKAESQIEKSQSTYSSNSVSTEIEILALLSSIKVKLYLDKLDPCEKSLYILDRIIASKKMLSENELLCDILTQYYLYYKAEIQIKRIERIEFVLQNDGTKTPYDMSVYEKRVFSFNERFSDVISDVGNLTSEMGPGQLIENKKRYIREVSENLLRIFYTSKYMDPELFIWSLYTLQKLIDIKECK